MNELLAQLRAAADNLHATLVVWETHIDHPGARTAIHSAARELLNAASVMPTHYDDGSELLNAARDPQQPPHDGARASRALQAMIHQFTDDELAAHDAEVRAQALAPIREALAGHPRCDIHPDGDPITCGWKRAVADIQAVLDREEQP